MGPPSAVEDGFIIDIFCRCCLYWWYYCHFFV